MQYKNNCRVCGEQVELQQIDREINNYILYMCPECKTVLVRAKPSDLSGSVIYNELFSQGEYEMHRNQFDVLSQGVVPLEFYRQRLLKYAENLVPGRELIEIGGGVGAFGVFCARRGWDYTDYDLSTVAVEYARKLGLRAYGIDDPSNLILSHADVVAMWEVIEHVWNVNEYLITVRKSLADNGLIILSTPNYLRKGYRTSNKWDKLSAPPIHVNFFTEESITCALKSAGFGFVSVMKPRVYRPSLKWKSILYNLQILLGFEETKTLYVIAGLKHPVK